MSDPQTPNGQAGQSQRAQLTTLAQVRQQIDQVDAAMHALLIERSAVISDLIAIKKVQPPVDGDPARRTSAFRPAREASMMRDMIERHTGLLPLDTVESIWRVIISTFTYVQAPYDVIYAQDSDALAMRDVARFHFGYTVPVHATNGPGDVLSSVGKRGDALGVIALSAQGAWWRALEDEDAPNVIARLPFVDRPDHPAGKPCLVVANAPIDREVMACTVLSIVTRDAAAPAPLGLDILARDGAHILASAPNKSALEALSGDANCVAYVEVGSHAQVFRPQT